MHIWNEDSEYYSDYVTGFQDVLAVGSFAQAAETQF